jgi:acyl-[acyl-carrier-protein] desaturase
MSDPLDPTNPELRVEFYRLYRDFFDRAERKRRWTVADDIPWESVNPKLDPSVADVVESFCTVEMYLPDYISKALPLIRANRGWAWFHANWGYEESKHSLALSDWLLKSKARTPEQLYDLEDQVFDHEWDLRWMGNTNHFATLVTAVEAERAGDEDRVAVEIRRRLVRCEILTGSSRTA